MKKPRFSEQHGDGELVRFRIYPDYATRYFLVVCFCSRAKMRAYWKRFVSVSRIERVQFEAGMFAERHRVMEGRKIVRVKPFLGWVLFYRGYMGMGTVSHEMTHAAVAFARYDGVDLNDLIRSYPPGVRNNRARRESPEERVATVQGNLVQQFYQRMADGRGRFLWGKDSIYPKKTHGVA
jgi:hypothetical protein